MDATKIIEKLSLQIAQLITEKAILEAQLEMLQAEKEKDEEK